jgi:oxygen-independent coproporphyrinogen-3 oxidase
MENWLALGPGASGTIINDRTGTGLRYTVKADTGAWLNRRAGSTRNGDSLDGNTCTGGPGYPGGWPPVTEEPLGRAVLIKETLLMGFRLAGGPDGELFQRRFGRGIGETIPGTIAAWQERGLFRKDRTALTGGGLLFLNPFLLDAFQEIDAHDRMKRE